MIRTFIAIDIPEDLKKKIASVQEQMKQFNAPVRWVSKPSFHLTLKFLGYIDESTVSTVCKQLDAIAQSFKPFRISLRRLGTFPDLSSPRVIWMGVRDDGDLLSQINEKVESAMDTLDFEKETRPYSPHLTLGRVKGKDNLFRLATFIKLYGDNQIIGEFPADKMHLFKSTLKRSGAVYEKLHSFNLRA